MGQTRLSEAELSARIQTGRYEFASKAEVKAFVDSRLRSLAGAMEEQIDEEIAAERKVRNGEMLSVDATILECMRRLHALERTPWQRFKQWVSEFIEDLLYAVYSDPSEFPMDDAPATVLPHGSQAQIDAFEKQVAAEKARIVKLRSDLRFTDPFSGPTADDPYQHLARSLQQMPTECVEDLAENPLIEEAIEQIKAYEGEKFDPSRYPGLIRSSTVHPLPPSLEHELPELQGLPEYTAEDMPSLIQGKTTHDGELEKPWLTQGSVIAGERIEIPPEDLFPSLGDPEE